jgi:hypothetical protein
MWQNRIPAQSDGCAVPENRRAPPSNPSSAPKNGFTALFYLRNKQSTHTTKLENHPMAKSDYLSPNDESFAAQLQTFKNTIGGYAAMLGVSPAQVTAQAADGRLLPIYVLACQAMLRNGGIR